MLYVDTSVLVAALTREKRTREMQDWLAGRIAGEMAISDWVITEFSGALSLMMRAGHLGREDRADVLAVFAQMIEASFIVLPVARIDFHTAARLADQHTAGLRAGDALHLAIAVHHGARIRSLDKTLVHAARKLGVSAALV